MHCGTPELGRIAREADISFLDTGILNYAYAIRFHGVAVYLKQALERAKAHDRIGPDLAGVPPERVVYEARFIEVVRALLGPDASELVPRILHLDAANHVLVTRDVSCGGSLLESELRRGRISARVAASLGGLLGRMHAATLDRPCPIRGSNANDEAHWMLFLRMRTIGCLKNAALPESTARALRGLAEEAAARHTRHVLLHVDYCPKNLFARPDERAAVIDFELGAGVGDPAYDLGFLLGHYLLLTPGRAGIPDSSRSALTAMLEAYLSRVPGGQPMALRAQRYAAATVLYRIFGSSRSFGLSDDDIPALQELASRLLLADRVELS